MAFNRDKFEASFKKTSGRKPTEKEVQTARRAVLGGSTPKKPAKAEKPPKPEPLPKLPLTPEQQLDLQKDKLKVKQEGLADQVKLLTERNLLLEQQVSTMMDAEGYNPQIIIISPKVPDNGSESVAVIVASDWHIEEQIIRAQVSGLNEFNLEICDKRVTRFWQGAMRLIEIMNRDTAIK